MLGGIELAGQLFTDTTVNTCLLPSARTTQIGSPGWILASLPNMRGCPGYPAWPSMTASPGAPGTGPALYQPTSQMLIGVSIAPYWSRPSGSTGGWRLSVGRKSLTGGEVG